MRRLTVGLALLLACSDDEATPERDATVRDATVSDATVSDANVHDASADAATPRDAAPPDTTCYSPLRPPAPSTSYPTSPGCACDRRIEREPYCLGRLTSGTPYLLACNGVWSPAADGNCASFLGGPERSCARRLLRALAMITDDSE